MRDRSEATEIFGRDSPVSYAFSTVFGKTGKRLGTHVAGRIDGALVGGASLEPKSFAAIVKY